ncbi:hypothetical protein HCJ93_24595 [Streptomyces sp. SBST2-5]|uniref:Uncharacterized protein n=1 Tax=Streptomyces composti TaxID=2720025 RepID=A0ABX1AH26_9ACTN|nr:hypothetical protein [Streptomyces composti]NJP53159.1 hypothetical protein [Streptomyces composti]
MTTDTPQRTTQRPPVRLRFTTRIRGRHRRPRHRKALVAAGGLALAMGAMSVVRLATTPGPADTAIGATPVTPAVTLSPSAAPSSSPDRPGTPRPARPRPTSPTALGAKDSTPLPEATEPKQRASAPPPGTTPPSGPDTPAPASPTHPAPPQDRRPAPGPPAPPHAPSTPPPPPTDDTPGTGGDGSRGLCVPLLGLCLGGGLGLDLGLGG